MTPPQRLTDAQIAALKAKAEIVTPRRWVHHLGGTARVCDDAHMTEEGCETVVEVNPLRRTRAETVAIAAYLAAVSPEILLALVGEVEEQRADMVECVVIPEADAPMPPLEMFDGYPTEGTLGAIRHWPYRHVAALFDEVARIWHWGYGIGDLSPIERKFIDATEGARYLRLATGGWSGNEDIIRAMKANVFVRHYLVATRHGGLYIFEYPHESLPAAPEEPR